MTAKKPKPPPDVDTSSGMKTMLKDVQVNIDKLEKEMEELDKLDRLAIFSKMLTLFVVNGSYLESLSKIITKYRWAESHSKEELAEYLKAVAGIFTAGMQLFKVALPEHRLGDMQYSAMIEELCKAPKAGESTEDKIGKMVYNG